MAGGPGLDLGDIDRIDSRFKRRLAACIILVTLLSSVVGFLAADAGAREDENAREAERYAVAAMAEDAEAYVGFYGGLAGYAEAQPAELRRRMAEARDLAGPGWLRGRRRPVEGGRRRPGRPVVAAGGRLPGGGGAAPLPGPLPPGRPGLAAPGGPARHRRRLGRAVERYSAILTILAIVLAVLGLAATFGQRMWRPLVRPAVAVALACLALAAVGRPRVPAVPENAMAAGRRGRPAAGAGQRRRGGRGVLEGGRPGPGYAVAYVRRAGAYALQGSPEQDQSYVFSSADSAARARSMDDLERAFELGADDDLLAVATQAANYFSVGRYGDAEALARRASDRNPRLAAARLSLGLAQAAQGRTEEAVAAFDRVAGQAVATTERNEREEAVRHRAHHPGAARPAGARTGRPGAPPPRPARRRRDHGRGRPPLRQLAPGTAIADLSLSADARSLTATYPPGGSARTTG